MNTEKLNIKKGIERLARIYNWPNDSTITDMDKYEFRALCEFIIFKEFVFTPFFKSLLSYLFKHIGKLYQHLSTLPMDKARMLTYKEAYLFFRVLGTDKVKQILEQTSYPYNVYNRIIRSLEDEDYNLFFSTFDNSDYTKIMQVLWVMRYVLLGEKGNWNDIDPSIPHITLLPYLPRWINSVDNYRPFFKVHEKDDEDILLNERILEIVCGRVRIKRKRNSNSSPLNDSNENFEENTQKELERFFDESLFKSQWKDLLTEFTDNSDFPKRNSKVNTTYIEDLARLILTHNVILHKDYIKERYGIDSSEVYNQFRNTEVYIYENRDSRDFGRYIMYCIGEMHIIYNKVKGILSNEANKILNDLCCSELLRTITAANCVTDKASKQTEYLNDNSSSDCTESRLITEWKKKNGKLMNERTFTILIKLKDEEIKKLTKGLADKEFIEKNTNPKRLTHILGGEKNDGGEPIIWIKKASRNKYPSKKSVLNFLRLLGVKFADITPDRLNCCFICSTEDTYKAFNENNIFDKGKRNAASEYNEDLKSIIETALDKDHAIFISMQNVKLTE